MFDTDVESEIPTSDELLAEIGLDRRAIRRILEDQAPFGPCSGEAE